MVQLPESHFKLLEAYRVDYVNCELQYEFRPLNPGRHYFTVRPFRRFLVGTREEWAEKRCQVATIAPLRCDPFLPRNVHFHFKWGK